MDVNSVKGTLAVALFLCLVCSSVVSISAVKLKGIQDENKALDVKKNLLLSASLIKDPKASKEKILESFKKITPMVIDLGSGMEDKNTDASTYDQKAAAKDPKQNYRIDGKADIAKIKVRAKKALVYVVEDGGSASMVILPIHGKGLWSTMYGFLALDKDTKTVKGLGFYSHLETPGLGGEVDNPEWKAQWIGKEVFDGNFKPAIKVIKGKVSSNDPQAKYKADGMSGATITSVGVQHLINYWLGDNAFGPFLKNFREGKI